MVGAMKISDQDALDFHSQGKPGKIEVTPTKTLATQRDLSLAYSPGVAVPCLEIEKEPATAYDYTSKGNLVAVISNGTAVLGLGNIGALAAKPVMEGKAVLFKKFADIDGIDLEVDTEDVDEFINCVKFLGKSFGGINLEDIKAPECFIIEQKLKECLDIPVFHDDQHGTAIISLAGLINALYLTERDIKKARVVVNGAGAAAIAGVELFKALGMPHKNVIICDSKGVVYKGREEGMNQWKSAHAADTELRTLEDAVKGADVLMGLSIKGAFSKEIILSMSENPVIFAMANPDPEITPEEVAMLRSDAIMATGRSDYPNQVNNVLGFPYIFRGALDVRASEINDAMKIAAARAIALLAREDVPDEVSAAYGKSLQFGRDYIIPAPFDPRLIVNISLAVAKAAMETGVARKPIADFDEYERNLRERLNPTASSLSGIYARVRQAPKRVVFAEGEEERVIRAAVSFQTSGYGQAVLIGRENAVKSSMDRLGLSGPESLEIHNARLSDHNDKYTHSLYKKLQRKGHLYRDVQRMVNNDRNVFGASMVAHGHADAMVTGVTRSFGVNHEYITRVLDPKPGHRLMTCSLVVTRNTALFIADTNINEVPDAETIADIATQTATKARAFGYEPKVALLSFSNFGYPQREHMERVQEAVRILDRRKVDFEYDGEMNVDVALDMSLRRNYPFCRLSGPANVLVMPGLHAANISYKLLQAVGGGTIIGPMLLGLEKPVQIVQMNASVNDLVQAAVIASHDTLLID